MTSFSIRNFVTLPSPREKGLLSIGKENDGDLDIVMLSGDQVEQVEGDPELMVTGAGYLWYLTLNMNDVPALNNQNMRLALSNAVNRVSIVEDVVKDGSVATYTAVPPQFAAGPDGSDFSADQEMFKDVCADDTDKAAAYYEAARRSWAPIPSSLSCWSRIRPRPRTWPPLSRIRWRRLCPA